MLKELRSHGVELISATENIDETAEGRMLHGILSTLAEYEVAKLAGRVAMGMEQKVRMGGTPGRAKIGYHNVGAKAADGHEYRTIAVDEERAPHIQWAFRTYDSGDYSLNELVLMLDARGLRSNPRYRDGQPKPLTKSMLGRVLRDRYYTGKVHWKGEWFDGNHEPLISQTLEDVPFAVDVAAGGGPRFHAAISVLHWGVTLMMEGSSVGLGLTLGVTGLGALLLICRPGLGRGRAPTGRADVT